MTREELRKQLVEHCTAGIDEYQQEQAEFWAWRFLSAFDSLNLVVMPREPTKEMIEAAEQTDISLHSTMDIGLAGIYRAMLAAWEGKDDQA